MLAALVLASCAHPDPCRGPHLALFTAYERCTSGIEALSPDPTRLEVTVPPAISVVSGGRVSFSVELVNRSDAPLELRLDQTFTTLVQRNGRRVAVLVSPPADVGRIPVSRVVLEPGGVLTAPMGVTAWATVERDGERAIDAPVPPGEYEAELFLPWGLRRTVPLTVTPRAAGFTDPGWPHGDAVLACQVDGDCRVVESGCAAQVVSASRADDVATLHATLSEEGLCAPPTGRAITARCDGALCVE